MSDERPQVYPLIRRRFEKLTQDLRQHGAYVGTGHKRILIPKTKVTEKDLNGLGFVPVTIAIPESGQDQFTSYRHPDHLLHLHSHPEGWTMHEDEHHSSTMLMRKEKSTAGKAKAFVSGIPHVSDEGLPGLYYYVKGLVAGGESTAQRVAKEVPVHVQKKINRWVDSPTHAPTEKAAFATSAFSGDLGPGSPLPYASGIPPFRVAPLKKSEPKTAALNAMADELMKLNGVALSPATRLSSTQMVGAPRVTAKAGPSISAVSKPPGMGTALAGTTNP